MKILEPLLIVFCAIIITGVIIYFVERKKR